MLQSVHLPSELYFFPVMHKRVIEPVLQLPLVRQSSDCLHVLLLLSLIGFLTLFLDCYVFDLPLHPPPPPPLPHFFPIRLWITGAEEERKGAKEENRVEASSWSIKEGLWGASHS